MIGSIGPLEIGIVFVVALLVFGPKRLPELGNSLGRGVRDFQKGIKGEAHRDGEPTTEQSRAGSNAAAVGNAPLQREVPEQPRS
jgi:sec-independent protein translocase protein TatA